MNHTELVTRAGKWLRNTKRLPCVLCEVGTASYECPDVIGFTTSGFSVLVECKVSLEDFKRDAKKPFRHDSALGMGYERWYAFPVSLFNVSPWLASHEAIPRRWGVVIFDARRATIWRKPEPFYDRNERGERALLVSAFRRATEGWGRYVFPELRGPDPHPTIAKTIDMWKKEATIQREQRERAEDEIVKLRAELERLRAPSLEAFEGGQGRR